VTASAEIQWLLTEPDPRSPATGFNAGRRGWVRHAVRALASEKFSDVRRRRSLCGVLPRHGWGDDSYIPEGQRRKRCAGAAAGQVAAPTVSAT
jgi:hypothetical protein